MGLADRNKHRTTLTARRFYAAAAIAAVALAGAAEALGAERGRAYGPGAGAAAGPARGFAASRPAMMAPGGGFGRPLAGRPAQGAAANGFPRRTVAPPGFAGRPAGMLARNGLPRRAFPGEAGFTGVPPRGETRFITNEMIVHVAEDVSPQVVDAAARRLGLSVIGSQPLAFTNGTLIHLQIDNGIAVADAVRAFEAENIGIAQPNYLYRLQQDLPLAPAAALAAAPKGDAPSYVVAKLRLPEVHRIATGDNVLVAVIDSKVDAAHPDLAGSIAATFDATAVPDRPDEHGTGMTGAIAAHRKVLGVAPQARILAVHAFNANAQSQQATSQSIVAGIDWAIAKGARVINMSFAGPYDPVLALALKKAHDKGVVLVAAAGNLGPQSPPLYPAADENVIAVTAVDVNDKLLPQASRGPHIALASPGVDVLETAPRAGYAYTTGTSVAAAHVSGAAALLIERDPTIDVATLENLLFSTAKDLGTPGRDQQFGFGLVDPYQALSALEANVAFGRPAAPVQNHAADGTGPPAAGAASPAATAAERSAPVTLATASSSPPGAVAGPSPSGASAPPATPARAPAAKPAVTQAGPANAVPNELGGLSGAAEKKRQSCRQDGLSKHVRGEDMAEFVSVCVDEARLACLRQAVLQKIRAPERYGFINRCLIGS